ncbi:hypothetical protein G7Y89_g11494 [Cudoniella acicularis]|uniref:Uncharacterized protein n=1 Tax=Cudoniella acicularis TaxID=354080 RepID=A0A8H4REE6_9HELO|nr:hypothetical protein G7Y89_g11494 [Cudoniella acicularis]
MSPRRNGVSGNDYFKRRIRLVTIAIAVISGISIAFFIASYGLTQWKSFRWTKYTKGSIQQVEFCVFLSLIISTTTLFLPIPLAVNILLDFALPILVSIYTARIFTKFTWPNQNWSPSPSQSFKSNPCKMPRYNYNLLNEEAKEIRLLTILPASKSAKDELCTPKSTYGRMTTRIPTSPLEWNKLREIHEPTVLKGDWVDSIYAYMYMSSRVSGIRIKGYFKPRSWVTPELNRYLEPNHDTPRMRQTRHFLATTAVHTYPAIKARFTKLSLDSKDTSKTGILTYEPTIE